MYCPPEWLCLGYYRQEPATVWSLGVLLYVMVCGCFPFRNDHDTVSGQLFFWRQVSPGWCGPQEGGFGRRQRAAGPALPQLGGSSLCPRGPAPGGGP